MSRTNRSRLIRNIRRIQENEKDWRWEKQKMLLFLSFLILCQILITWLLLLGLSALFSGVSPLWTRGQSSWLQIQRSQVRFTTSSDFLSSSGSVGLFFVSLNSEASHGIINTSQSLLTEQQKP
jgi:hypothetical protein